MEKMDERLSLEEMIKLARTAKKWVYVSWTCGKNYSATINTGNGNRLSIKLSRQLPFINAIDVDFSDNNIGSYVGTNKELRELRKEVG